MRIRDDRNHQTIIFNLYAYRQHRQSKQNSAFHFHTLSRACGINSKLSFSNNINDGLTRFYDKADISTSIWLCSSRLKPSRNNVSVCIYIILFIYWKRLVGYIKSCFVTYTCILYSKYRKRIGKLQDFQYRISRARTILITGINFTFQKLYW
jgi:hypothetical protein